MTPQVREENDDLDAQGNVVRYANQVLGSFNLSIQFWRQCFIQFKLLCFQQSSSQTDVNLILDPCYVRCVITASGSRLDLIKWSE